MHGTITPCGFGVVTELADLDFETYSEAGYVFDHGAQKWRQLNKSGTGGLPAVGAPVYAAHPSTRILSMAYDLKDGLGARLWLPGCPDPLDLFEHVRAGKLLEAHNAGFERLIWHYVCVGKMGWPAMPLEQWRCSKAKARVFGLPAALGELGKALNLTVQKDSDGTRLLNKFSKPRNPTKTNAALFNDPSADPIDGPKLYGYNITDIVTEAEASARLPDLTPNMLDLWLFDQRVNWRGCYIDMPAVDALIATYENELQRATTRLIDLTGDTEITPTKVEKLHEHLERFGVSLPSLDADTLDAALKNPMHPTAYEILKIRQSAGSSNAKKLYAFKLRTSPDGYMRDMFEFYGAGTGRFAGRGAQPQNMASAGPAVVKSQCCGVVRSAHLKACPYCMLGDELAEKAAWGEEGMNTVIEDCKAGVAAQRWPDVIEAITGTLRGLFIAPPGHDLISADYSAIEAVVLAQLAGEQWRIDVFNTHGKIYEMSASKISGVPFDEMMDYKKRTGEHHPLRKTIGKVAELASGYAGWIGAWKAFGADAFMTEDEIKQAILKWRAESPAIVELWGGQWRRGARWGDDIQDFYGLEGCAVQAILSPGTSHSCGAAKITFMMHGDQLYCFLPSGRPIVYQSPQLDLTRDKLGRSVYQISYMGYNSDASKGPIGWMRRSTYGGKLCENVTQAVACDVMTFGARALERAGYSVVLHVHDEIVSAVPKGWGSVDEFERIMSTMPQWAAGWPIKAAGGWRGLRYRK